MSNYLFISDAAKEVKVESHVLRYWEEELHLPIKRNELGHRYYTEEDVKRFKEIKSMKERGLQLKAIKVILKDGKLDVITSDEAEQQDTSKESVREDEDKYRMSADLKQEDNEKMQTISEKGAPEGERSACEGKSGLAIDIIPNRETQVVQENREEKSRRLQWLLQQMIRETLQENNGELCKEIKESVVKELDYQFRMQEEREEARDRMMAERDEEHYKKMDELLRKKSKASFGLGKKRKGTP